MIEIRNIKVSCDADKETLQKFIMKRLRMKSLPEYEILKRSIDARKKPDIYYIYQVGVYLNSEKEEIKLIKKLNDNNILLSKRVSYELPVKEKELKNSPIIIGAGPAGLFCAYILSLCGYAPVVIERGLKVEERIQKVNDFWKGKVLDPECNVQFGEGGAGTFSDGKLNTQVKDKYGRIRFILEQFVRNGADPEIIYDNKPHIGTDVLTTVISNMRKEIETLGGTFLFDTKAEEIHLDNAAFDNNGNYEGRSKIITGVKVKRGEKTDLLLTDNVVLAIGHSARDTFSMLYKHEIPMVSKDFAMGVRIEHPEKLIRKVMYGEGEISKKLPAPPYKLTYKTKEGRGVYSFCMCPGGYVVNASSEKGGTAVNGMSYSGRSGVNSNSALIVTVKRSDFGSDSPLAGVELQRKLERAVYEEGNGFIAVQRYGDFKKAIKTEKVGSIIPQTKGDYKCCNVAKCLPDYIRDSIIEAMPSFDREIPGFADDDAVISGVESRTSSPLRILRNDDLQSEGVYGLYPCGEGAGYAGGIMSAAIDGMKVAEAIIRNNNL